jgi:hypothetical protein
MKYIFFWQNTHIASREINDEEKKSIKILHRQWL